MTYGRQLVARSRQLNGATLTINADILSTLATLAVGNFYTNFGFIRFLLQDRQTDGRAGKTCTAAGYDGRIIIDGSLSN